MTSTVWPGAFDVFTDPTPTTLETQHAELHDEENDAIAAMQQDIGKVGTTDTGSIRFKLSGLLAATKLPMLTGLVGDNGATDNYSGGFGGGSPLDVQLTAVSNAGGGEVVVPAALGYYGISTDLDMTNYPGVILKGLSSFKLKSPGSSGTMSFGSGFGPYVGTGGSRFIQAIVHGDTAGCAFDNITVIAINATNATTYKQSAPAAGYFSGAGGTTSIAARARRCSFWGGIVSTVIFDTGSDDGELVDCELNNGTYSPTSLWGYNGATAVACGNISPTGTIRGLNMLVAGSADHRMAGVQSFNGPWRLGCNTSVTVPWGTLSGGSSDMNIAGPFHISAPSGANPTQTNLMHLYLDSGTGGIIGNYTLDNGNSGGDLQCYVYRNHGHWLMANGRAQTGNTTYGYPIFQEAGTDLAHGLQVRGLHVSASGSPLGFTSLLDTLGGASNLNNSLLGVVIDGTGNVLGNPPVLWTAAGTPTSTILPGQFEGFQEGNPPTFLPSIGGSGLAGFPITAPALTDGSTYVYVSEAATGWTWTSGGSKTVTPASAASLVKLQGGMAVSGSNVPPNTFISSVNRGAGTLTLTNSTTAGTGGTLTIKGWITSAKATLSAARIQPNAPGNTEAPWGLVGINSGGPALWQAAGCTVASSGGSTTITIPFSAQFDATSLNVNQPVSCAGVPSGSVIGSITDPYHVVVAATSTPGSNITVTFGNDTMLGADSSWDPALGSFWRTPGGSPSVGAAPTDWTLDGASGLTLPDYLTDSGLLAASGDPLTAGSTIQLASGTLYLTRVTAFAGAFSTAMFLTTIKGVLGSTGVGGAELFIWTLPTSGGPANVYASATNVDAAITGAIVGGLPTPQSIALASAPITGFRIGAAYWVGLWIPTNWANGSGAIYPTLAAPSVAAANAANVFNDRFATFATGTAPTSLPVFTAGQSAWIGLK